MPPTKYRNSKRVSSLLGDKHKIHKYRRTFVGKKLGKKNKDDAKPRTPIWRCMLPNCQHYLFTETVIGKTAICWKCDDTFNIKKFHLERVRPVCSKCRGIVEKSTMTEQQEADITSGIEAVLEGMNLDMITLGGNLKKTG
jgi:hypothetical protein